VASCSPTRGAERPDMRHLKNKACLRRHRRGGFVPGQRCLLTQLDTTCGLNALPQRVAVSLMPCALRPWRKRAWHGVQRPARFRRTNVQHS
jgi:hypothetical protein